MSERTPLYVRLPAAEARKLDRAAFELGASKQDLVTGLVARYVDPTSEESLAALRVIAGDLPLGRHDFQLGEDPEVLTPEEAGELLQVEPEVVVVMATAGRLPGRKLGDEWRFSRSALLAWLAGEESRDGKPRER
jgi:excisionase family DNA binding protein